MTKQIQVKHWTPTKDLSGQVFLVTGANATLGFECSRTLLKLKASTVIFGCRSMERAEKARDELLADPEIKRLNPDGKIKLLQLDLSDFESVKNFVTELSKEFPKLNGVVLNAGITSNDFRMAKTGYEIVTQVNFLSNALLMLLLLPLLESTEGQPRMTLVGSLLHRTHRWGRHPPPMDKPIMDYMNDQRPYNRFWRYGESKLLAGMYIRQLSKRVDGKKVIINHNCPGFVLTNLDVELPFYMRWPLRTIKRLKGRDPPEGSLSLTYAVVEAGEDTHGKFLSRFNLFPTADWLSTETGKKNEEKLWEEANKIFREVDPRVGPILDSLQEPRKDSE